MSDEEEEHEDRGPFEEWLRRGISNTDLTVLPRFLNGRVPDRDPTADSPWRPRGPANIAGRVRSLVLDPELVAGRPRTIIAGAASGGVFRSLDQGVSWESIWPGSMPCPAIGAMAIGAVPATAATDPGTRVLWVGTGEKDMITGDGVWRLRLAAGADGPIDWVHAGTLEQINGVGAARVGAPPTTFAAAAVDPDNPSVAWFVGPTGAYRCTEHPIGTFTWARFTAMPGPGCADVSFVRTTHGRYVVLALDGTTTGDLMLLDDPGAPQAAIQGVLTARSPGLAQPLQPTPPIGAPTFPSINARIAIVPDAVADRVYAVYTTQLGANRPLLAFGAGSIAATGAPAVPTWSAAVAWPTPQSLASPGVFANERQGEFNLTLAALARAGQSDLVALGMVDLFVSVDGGTTFTKSLDFERYDAGDRGQHADQHTLAFAPDPGPTSPLWVGNDGGVAVSSSYVTAAGVVAPTTSSGWRRRVAGMAIGQVYDVTQSAALPDVVGVALQDVGGWVSGGSATWRRVLGGDGLSIAFDPHDPHHMFGSAQGVDDEVHGVDDIRFSGSMDFSKHVEFTGARRALFRGVTPHRTLSLGMAAGDDAHFEDLIAHPTRPGHLIHIRRRRFYTSTDGERWSPPLVGDRIQLLVQLDVMPFPAPTPAPATPPNLLAGVIVTIGGTAAIGLGFMPGETSDLRTFVGQSTRRELFTARITSARPRPEVAAHSHLEITIELLLGQDGGERFRQTIDIEFPAATADLPTILARIRTGLSGPLLANWTLVASGAAGVLPDEVAADANALPAFVGDTFAIELVSNAVGSDIDVTLGGAVLPALRGQARAYGGDRDRPAVAPLFGREAPTSAGPMAPDPAPPADLTVAVHRTPAAPGALVPIGDTLTFPWPGPQPLWSFGVLVASNVEQVRSGMARPAGCRVWTGNIDKWIRLRAGRRGHNALTPFALSGSALPRLTAVPPTGDQLLVDLRPRKLNRYDLTTPAAPSRLTFTIGVDTINVDFAAAAFGASLTDVTVEEVRRTIEEVLNHDPVLPATDIQVEVQRSVESVSVQEVAFSPVNPSVIWIGGQNHVLVTTDGGTTWAELIPQPPVTDPTWLATFWVEAIAPDPFPPADPANPVYTALIGVRGRPGFEFIRCSTAAASERLPAVKRGAGYDTPDENLEVYAIVGDPRRRGVYYAATDVGVLRTEKSGDLWEPFSQGLPHTLALDLALDNATDTLRVGLYGRGIYERALDPAAAALPDIYLRANQRDAGRRPVAHGPDLDGDVPAWVDAARSPDLRLVSFNAAQVAAIDAVEMDDLVSEGAQRDVPYQLLIRANNRSSLPVEDARVVALWADGSATLPPLPASFWTSVAGGPIAGGVAHGAWRVIGDTAVPRIVAGDARVVAMPVSWPVVGGHSPIDAFDRVAIIAVAIRGNTSVEAGPSDVARLVVHDPHVALRLVDVVAGDDMHITLRVVQPDTGPILGITFAGAPVSPAAAPAGTLRFSAPGAHPEVLRSSTVAPFDTTGSSVRLVYIENHVNLPPVHVIGVPPATPYIPAPDQTHHFVDLAFADAAFANPAAVSAAEMRAFVAPVIARHTRLIRVEGTRIALELRRNELVVRAPLVAITDDDFGLLSLMAVPAVTVAAQQRFATRVWNTGNLDVTDATVRFFWLDPHADTPTATQLGADQVVTVTAGQHSIVSVDATIPALSHDDVLVIVELDHSTDPAPARSFMTWGDVLTWARHVGNTIMRSLRRA